MVKRKKSKNTLYGLSLLILIGSGLWFFLLYASIAPESLPLLQIGKPLPNQTDINITYFLEINNNQIIINESQEESKTSFLDVTGIITGLIVGTILLVISRVVKPF